jgi:hypothetical protein
MERVSCTASAVFCQLLQCLPHSTVHPTHPSPPPLQSTAPRTKVIKKMGAAAAPKNRKRPGMVRPLSCTWVHAGVLHDVPL